ncbi:unnamed protein product [Prorocentrum cordatum]|uniref:Uncharacterized protein n=1 Tax=Prorocentrum cordatum TaxID=2364126 RepID=A0ABN9VHG6_9DINO|nr:unnamed protein product [Polarella glacialis]
MPPLPPPRCQHVLVAPALQPREEMSWWEQPWSGGGWRADRQWASSSWARPQLPIAASRPQGGGHTRRPAASTSAASAGSAVLGCIPSGVRAAGMDGGLLSLLESKGLTFLTDTLSRLGVARVSDFRYLSEQDRLGMQVWRYWVMLVLFGHIG